MDKYFLFGWVYIYHTTHNLIKYLKIQTHRIKIIIDVVSLYILIAYHVRCKCLGSKYFVLTLR
jgi:hypothetical protein